MIATPAVAAGLAGSTHREVAILRAVIRAYRSAYSGLPREVWAICAALLVNRAGTMVLPFLVLFLTVERGLSVVVAGRLLALWGVGAAIGSFLGGGLSDRLGPVRTQHLTLLLSGAGFLAFVHAQGTLQLTVAVLLLSAISEAFRPSAMAAIAEFTKPGEQVRSFALMRLAANFGMSIGPAVGGLLAVYNYEWLFWADGVTCWFASGLLFLTVKEVARPSHAHDEHGAPIRARSPWTDGPFLGLLVLSAAVASVVFQVFSTMPVYFERVHGLRENHIGLLLGLNAMIIVIFEMLLLRWVERFRRMSSIAVGCLLTCLGLGLMPFAPTLLALSGTVVVWTVGEMLTLPLLSSVVAERASRGNYGRYMGAYTFAYAIAFIIAPGGGTWIYERFGPDPLWFGIGIFGPALAAYALLLAGPIRRDRVAGAAPAPVPVAASHQEPVTTPEEYREG